MALKCCICGNKIGFTEPLGTLSSQYSNMKLCSKCMNKKRDLESLEVELYTQSIEYFKKYKESMDLNAHVLDVVNSWISKGENRLDKNTQEAERLLRAAEQGAGASGGTGGFWRRLGRTGGYPATSEGL